MARGYQEFLKRASEDSTFAKEAKTRGKIIAEAEGITDDREILIKVGRELGYEFTMGDIERDLADGQEVDDEMLEGVAAGFVSEDGQCSGEPYGSILGHLSELWCDYGEYYN